MTCRSLRGLNQHYEAGFTLETGSRQVSTLIYISCCLQENKDEGLIYGSEVTEHNRACLFCSFFSRRPLLRLEQREDGWKPWQAGDKDAPQVMEDTEE